MTALALVGMLLILAAVFGGIFAHPLIFLFLIVGMILILMGT